MSRSQTPTVETPLRTPQDPFSGSGPGFAIRTVPPISAQSAAHRESPTLASFVGRSLLGCWYGSESGRSVPARTLCACQPTNAIQSRSHAYEQ